MNKPVVISVASNKGGVGKTATTAALAHTLSTRGYKVLVVDTDPQGNVSNKFQLNADNRFPNYIGTLLEDRMRNIKKDITEYIYAAKNCDNIDVIVSDQRLDATFQTMSGNSMQNMHLFEDIFSEVKALNRYDFILVDTRPALRYEVGSVFLASDWILIPIHAAGDSVSGASDVLQFCDSIKRNGDFKILGIFFNMVSNRTRAFQDYGPFIQENWAEYIMETTIPRSQDVINAENEDMPVTKLYPHSKVSKAFIELTEEVVNRIGITESI